jgi:UDP-N-acetylmuramoyl-tripeptide--D-alanyl-D-alanine ligase
MMKGLVHAIPIENRGAYAPDSESLIANVLSDLRAGDVVMVKGSLGSRMAKIIDAMKTRFGVLPSGLK